MNKQTLIKTLKIILPIAFGVFLIWLTYNKATPKERADVIKYIKNANYFWVYTSILLGFLSHLSRAFRWKYTLEPIGYHPSLANRFMAVMIAYFANLGIPRSGEILRATTLTTYENIPFEKGFGTIIAERIADLIMSIIIVLVALIFQYEMVSNVIISFVKSSLKKLSDNPKLLVSCLVLSIVFGFLALRYLKNPNNRFTTKIKSFVTGLKDGIFSILHMKDKWAFIFHTIFIWTMYVLMFYVVFFAVEETQDISIGAALSSFISGSFTIAATNGGLGSFPYVISETLILFNISKASGLAIGWIIWSAQTFLTIIAGALSFFLLPILNQKK